ncbi:E3 ubiquitin-protein ligase RNF13 [Drosophila mauritiana]|uniref:RING-type E3 ubiquitin transferase n=1 Tax=Drosophila mauritiana TaxID=7226 RepID=A0A6P8KAD3_DROMA|nr:E3 ubiquitin-protein ligase RNF13 [Drosophila mauritiana]XP_033165218.1 E3 ubiquitin-protein ligase RNF13 [Drosophila mauritiana]
MSKRSCHILTLLGLCLVCHEATLVRGHVLVYRKASSQLIEEFNDLPAQFGPHLPSNGLKVYVVPARRPYYGCDSLDRPPHLNYPPSAKFVALVARGECVFERKIRVAQNASYSAVIVYNNEGDDLEQMSADNQTGIRIPSVFVGHTTGKALATYFTPDVVLIINDELPFNINTQLILPFSILIGMCFIIMVIYMIYKCIREQRRLRRHRLPKSMLKKLPVLRYTKNNANNKYDTCVICLEDFIEDDKLRVLPCSHPYHTHCIDPWLTENRRVCPICKRKVFTKGEARASRSRQPSLDNVTDTDDDTTPLLQQQQSNGRQMGQVSSASSAAGAAAGSSSSVAAAAVAGTTRHGTFRRGHAGRNPFEESQSSDDENALLASTVRLATSSGAHERINPFDRAPNLPAHLAEQLTESRRSVWSRINFASFFRRQPAVISVAAPPYLERVESGTSAMGLPVTGTIAVASPASNNILNPNLSGSFKDEDDMPPHRSIYEPIAISTPAADTAAVDDSAFLQTPTQGGIGVAALPHSASDRQFLI